MHARKFEISLKIFFSFFKVEIELKNKSNCPNDTFQVLDPDHPDPGRQKIFRQNI